MESLRLFLQPLQLYGIQRYYNELRWDLKVISYSSKELTAFLPFLINFDYFDYYVYTYSDMYILYYSVD